ETHAQLHRLGKETLGVEGAAERAREADRTHLGCVSVSLHLDERDRRLRELAVLVEDGVVRVLPALVDEPVLGLPRVFEETIPVEIAVTVDPVERRLYVRPKRTYELHVAGPLPIRCGEHDEERRGIDAAVVEAERHLAERRHLDRKRTRL